MKIILFIQLLITVVIFTVFASAADRVVIIPLGGQKTTIGVAKTGQTIAYEGNDDGALKKGVTWPNPRFTDNADGTVTDNLTGLIWLKNVSCIADGGIWLAALNSCHTLANGTCDLTDGSNIGDWRLPNRNELTSLLDISYINPPLSNDSGVGQWTSGVDSAFSNVNSYNFWTSTTYADNTDYAWSVSFSNGFVDIGPKALARHVWPVRD